MSYREDERRWKRIQDMLAAEASGKELRSAVSQRTLFGIPSTVEQVINKVVAEDEEERRMKRQAANEARENETIDDLTRAYPVDVLAAHGFDPVTLDVAEVVALEQAIAAAGTPLAELMDRAGTAIARRVHDTHPQARVAVLCGSGNNGGDGWVAARELVQLGHEVTLVSNRAPSELKAQPAHDAAVAAQRLLAGRARVSVAPDAHDLEGAFSGADVVIDALLGTGFSGERVKAPYDSWIEHCNRCHERGAHVVAADVPSGLNAQTGASSVPCIQADETVTMIVLKPGLAASRAARACGTVLVAPLTRNR